MVFVFMMRTIASRARFSAYRARAGCVPGEPGCLLVRSASVPNLKTPSRRSLD